MTSPAAPTLAERLLIVPDAHLRVDDLDFQLEMYELFHRTPIGRLGHMLGTPTVLLGVFTGAYLVHPLLGMLVATAVGIGMAGNGLRLDRVAALLSAIATVVLAVAADSIAAHAEHGVVVALALVLGGCFVQTFSHLAEDVPPPQSEKPGFVPIFTWIRSVSVVTIVRSVFQTFLVFYWLEMWASLRILPLQLLHLAMRFGHRPELRRRLDARVADIVGGRDPHWRVPAKP